MLIEYTGDDKQKIGHAAHNLAGCAAACRRWARMGLMRTAYETLSERAPDRIWELRDAGTLNSLQARRLVELYEQVKAIDESRDDFLLEKVSGPRMFLWSHEFEDEEWREVAHTARDCLRALGRE